MWLPIIGAAAVILIYFLGAYQFYTGMKSREMKNAWKKLEVMEHIWESFYQNEKTKQKKERKVSNAGLGLYLVKKIVVQHKGECGAENREDGVEFWIRIPLLDGKKGEQDERKSDSENLRNGL